LAAAEQREIQQEHAKSQEIRRRVLAELDRNPLRAAAPPPPSPPPAANPLRGAEPEPRFPATPAIPALPALADAPPPADVPLAPATSPSESLAAREPSGGAAPPPRITAPKLEPPPVPVTDGSEYDIVEVLYGTDRQAGEQLSSSSSHLLLQFMPTVVIGLIAGCLIVVAIGRKSWLLGSLATAGFAGCGLLGYDAVDEVLTRLRGATHLGPRYTTDRAPGGKIELGRCEVTVPRTHEPGAVETPSIFRLEINENLSRHLILKKTERLASASFLDLLRRRVEQSARREVFVFVHGFNVSFEDAARRTAQIHYDLKFDGAPIFFSWPANDKFIFTYPADETNVAWSVPHLKQFLLDIVKESGAQSINLIAHSMGNRALAAALREIDLEMRDQARLFNQVILAAPDIDADDFRTNIAPAMQRTARGLTLYASSRDDALLASQFIHRRPRAGDAGEGLIVIPGIDTIDVTAIDDSLWGHSYYGSSHPVLQDLRALISRAVPPRERIWLSPADRDGQTYWIFQPTRTAALEAAHTH
jgi:esterase/lipase superfamily enzyme